MRGRLRTSLAILVSLLAIASPDVLRAATGTGWTIKDLGVLPGQRNSSAYGINDNGDVVGTSTSASTSDHAFIYRNGSMQELDPTVPRIAYAINNLGQVTGQRFGGAQQAWFWEEGKGFVDLQTKIGGGINYSAGFAINDRGQVVGRAGNSGFIWDPRTGSELNVGNLGKADGTTIAWGINNQGYVVGESVRPEGVLSAFVFDGVQTLDVRPPWVPWASALDINNRGEIVGEMGVSGFNNHAFLLSNGVLTDLGTLGGNTSRAFAINDNGWVVGYSNDRYDEGAFLYTPATGMQNLLHLVSGMTSGWTRLREARAINNKGQIVGSGIINGEMHAFIINPPSNRLPVADAGDNVTITTATALPLCIAGRGSDPDGDPLMYRWREGDINLSDWEPVGSDGRALLAIHDVDGLSLGEHLLTLEVRDAESTAYDQMILTIQNSAPHPAPTGGGTYQVNSLVVLGGQVSDYDGDLIMYRWLEGTSVLAKGEIVTLRQGLPVGLPPLTLSFSETGIHELVLQVDDGTNPPVYAGARVEVIDTEAPTLAPTPDRTILWPPNHQMVEVTVDPKVNDNSGGIIKVSATVICNEQQDDSQSSGLTPWYGPWIDEDTGMIKLQLRSERNGTGSGRTYDVIVTAIDASGNTSEATTRILVPHDQRR